MPDHKAIWAHGLATIPTFFAQVQQAFAYLLEKYNYTLAETESNLQEPSPTDNVDTYVEAHALVAYVSDHIEVEIVWGFEVATILISFVEVQTPSVLPALRQYWGRARPDVARAIRLDSLAAVRGHADDPDLLLGDILRLDGRSINRRFKLLQTNLTGVVDGLARAMERYANDVLRGDTSVFPEVMAYYTKQRRARGFWVGTE